MKKELKKSLEEAQHSLHTVAGPKLALVIDGKCLMYALDPSLRVTLLSLSLNCTSVVCCRVSPLQKAQVISDDFLNKFVHVGSLKGAYILLFWGFGCAISNHIVCV